MATTVTLKPNAIDISGSTSGTTTLQATAVAGTTTLTLPAATDTLVGKATTDTLTNKTLTGAVMNGTVGATTPSTGAFTTLSATGVTTVQAGTAAAPAITTSGDTNTGIFFPAADTIAFAEGGAEAMRIDSSGGVRINNTSNATFSAQLNTQFTTAFQCGQYLKVTDTSASQSMFIFGNSSSDAVGSIATNGSATSYNTSATSGVIGIDASTIAINTASSERMRIDSSGDVSIGATTVSSSARLNVYQADSAQRVVHFENTRNVSGDENLRLVLGSNCNNTSSYPLIVTTGGSQKLEIYGNGNVANVNNSYGALSDIKLKENIVDATPKLADLMQVKVRNYNLIGDTTKQIGVVAQELETVFPALVDESPDRDGEGGNLSTVTKSVKYSVFVPMLIKAIQEQQALITALTARITALEQA